MESPTRDESVASLLKLGADHVIVTDEEDLVARVHEITSGKGARIVFDPIGGRILESLAAATAPKGISSSTERWRTNPLPTHSPLQEWKSGDGNPGLRPDMASWRRSSSSGGWELCSVQLWPIKEGMSIIVPHSQWPLPTIRRRLASC